MTSEGTFLITTPDDQPIHRWIELGLDGGDGRRHRVAAMGEQGLGRTVGGSKVEVSVSFRDAWSRLTCAGWLPRDRVFGWERSARLRASVAGATSGVATGCS
jgi:hypothetical protein